MSHQDKDRQVRLNVEYLKLALQWLLGQAIWSGVCFRADCSWSPQHLAATALMWAWSDEATLVERFATARKIAQWVYQPQRDFATSYQAFLKLLVRWTDTLMAALRLALRQRMQTALAARWQVQGWILFGVDGSRLELPRTKSNEAAYSIAKTRRGRKVKRNRRLKPRTAAHSKKADTPLMWLTLLFHVGTGLPWAWRTGPTGSSEREHWRDMLSELPETALIAADAGFVGYDYTQAVLASGRHLLVRVGSNVRLLRQLGWTKESTDTVYLWPDRAAQRQQPPLVLRLVVATGGKHPVYLVTSVPATQLSAVRVIDFYRRRWGVEIYFRHLKQTFQRRKLRSTSAAPAATELDWSLIALWAMGLYAQVQQGKEGMSATRLSVAGVLRAFRRMLRDYLHPAHSCHSLRSLLRAAVCDNYQRNSKASRDYPCKRKADPPAGPPNILIATNAQQKHAKLLKSTMIKG